MADRKRKNRRQFWTTDEEDRIIEYKMEQVGFSNFGAFARKMLISGLIVKTDILRYHIIPKCFYIHIRFIPPFLTLQGKT